MLFNANNADAVLISIVDVQVFENVRLLPPHDLKGPTTQKTPQMVAEP